MSHPLPIRVNKQNSDRISYKYEHVNSERIIYMRRDCHIAMKLFNSLPKDFRDLVNEYGPIYTIWDLYDKGKNITEARKEMETFLVLSQAETLKELKKINKK